MSGSLLASIAGLSLLDSLNPATIVTVALILLTVPRRPVATALTFVTGALLTVLTVGLVIYASAGAAAGAVADGTRWLRRFAFAIAAVALAVSAYRRLSDRPRTLPRLPAWVAVRTAIPLGVVVTGADLPNAFPYFIAIERLLSEDVSTPVSIAVLGGYSLVYCLPCLVLVALYASLHERVQPWLVRVERRLGTGVSRRNPWAAAGLAVLSVAVAGVAVTA